MATIKDVAQHANVSVTTVSHAVNKTRPVSADKRQRIETAIRALGYVPSAVARSLKRKSTLTLGMLIPNSSNPYFAEIVRAVEDRCFGAGYALVLCNTDDEPHRQHIYLQVLAERRIDGLIVISSGNDDELISMLHDMHMPSIILDREIAAPRNDLVSTDQQLGALQAVRHLLALGHRRIACISGPAGLTPSIQRVKGWQQALSEAGIEPTADLLWHSDFTAQGGYEAMHNLLRANTGISALFACNDLLAMGAMRAAHETGLLVPSQLSVIGFDDIELANFCAPPLTTVSQPKQRIGRLAVDMLLERIHGQHLPVRKVLLNPELHVRSSTARYPGHGS